MTSFSSLGIGLSLVFGCLLLALIAELYYILWWKRRVSNRTRGGEFEVVDYTSCLKQVFHLWKKPSSLQIHNQTSEREQPQNQDLVTPDIESGNNKDLVFKAAAFGDDSEISEIMRLHNLVGPRFLFTIKEETKEDLESEDGNNNYNRRGSRNRSLSDILVTTTLESSPIDSSSSTRKSCSSPLAAYHNLGFNPLFESSTSIEADFNRFKSSPPPKFKFLRDAEEKLLKKLMEEADKRRVSLTPDVIKEGSFLKFIVGHHHLTTATTQGSSQILPLASSSPLSSHSQC